MRYLILSLALMLSACGQVNQQASDPRSITGTNEAFKPYIQMFEQLYGSSIGDIPIQFGSLTYPTIGVCTRWTTGHRQIVIEPSYWNRASEREKIGLIFHELGHCRLNRDHVSSTHYYYGTHIAGDVPDSLMYPYNFYSNSYAELESYYFEELFNPSISHSHEITLSSKDGCVVDIENSFTESN